MFEPEALVFDCDGTLVDTMPAHYRAWREILDPMGIGFTEARFYSLGGVPTREIFRLLTVELGLALDIERLARTKEAASARHLANPQPVPEVVAIARAARGRLPMAVATGSLRAVAEHALKGIGIHEWFHSVVAAEDVVRHKPAPDIYLLAAERLGVRANRCRAFEDTDLGLESARAAGMEAIDIRLLRGDR